jgi:hypothetical protein
MWAEMKNPPLLFVPRGTFSKFFQLTKIPKISSAVDALRSRTLAL